MYAARTLTPLLVQIKKLSHQLVSQYMNRTVQFRSSFIYTANRTFLVTIRSVQSKHRASSLIAEQAKCFGSAALHQWCGKN